MLLETGSTTCPYSGVRVRFLETEGGAAVVLKPSQGFHELQNPCHIWQHLSSCIDCCVVVVLDLSEMPSLTSSAVAEVVTLHKKTNDSGSLLRIAVSRARAVVRETLHTLHLDQLLAIHDSVEEALRSR